MAERGVKTGERSELNRARAKRGKNEGRPGQVLFFSSSIFRPRSSIGTPRTG